MLQIKNLHASVEDKEILKGINLEVKAGEVHAIMGPNGSGKSTLSAVIAGNENYEVTAGEVFLDGEDLSSRNSGCFRNQLYENCHQRNAQSQRQRRNARQRNVETNPRKIRIARNRPQVFIAFSK